MKDVEKIIKTKKKNDGFPQVKITWTDSRGITPEWEYRDEIKPILPCEVDSIGFLIEDKKDYVTVAQSLSRDQVLGRMSVPKVSIKKIEVL